MQKDKQIKKKFAYGQPASISEGRYFYFETSPIAKEDLAIVCGGHEICAPNYEICRRNYPYYCIKYTLKGKGRFRIHSKWHPITAGSFSGFGPGIAHHYKTDENDPMEHIFILFIGTKAEERMKRCTMYQKGIMIPPNPHNIMSLMEKILVKGLRKTPNASVICNDYLNILFNELADDLLSCQEIYSQTVFTFNTCKKYIDDNFSKITLPCQAADACGVNVRYMSRLFKKYAQISPGNYLMRLKMNKAANLLLTSKLSIDGISKTVGFEDQFHFSRNFKRMYAVSPLQFRKEH